MGEIIVSGCPSGWDSYKANCYKFFTEQMSWSEARNECLDLEANLASIHSEEENNFVTGLTGGNLCWLGGLRYENCAGCGIDCPNCGFLWTDGTPRNFDHWGRGQP